MVILPFVAISSDSWCPLYTLQFIGLSFSIVLCISALGTRVVLLTSEPDRDRHLRPSYTAPSSSSLSLWNLIPNSLTFYLKTSMSFYISPLWDHSQHQFSFTNFEPSLKALHFSTSEVEPALPSPCSAYPIFIWMKNNLCK